MKKKIHLWSAFLGNLFEHYDTALFGLLSPFLSPLLFPGHEPLTALILTYAIIPLGMFARPFGSLVFGYIGDVYGRKQALFLTLAGMAIVSGGIALTPLSFPLIFCLGRLLQNFFASGETMGGAIFLLENTPEKKHDLLSGLYNASTIGGILLASAGVSLLSAYDTVEPLWRLLYVAGCLTALFGCLIRRTLPTEAFSESPPQFYNLKQIFWTYRRPLFTIAISSGLSYASYSIALVLMNGFIPLVSTLTKAEMISLNTSLLALDFCALPLFGWLASKISREKMMLTASLCLSLGALPLFVALEGATLTTVIAIRMCFVLLGVAYSAPFHAFAQQLIPKAHRYAVISFGYAIGSQALGGPTTALSLWLYKSTGLAAAGALFIVVLAALNCFVLLFTLQNTSQKITNPLP